MRFFQKLHSVGWYKVDFSNIRRIIIEIINLCTKYSVLVITMFPVCEPFVQYSALSL